MGKESEMYSIVTGVNSRALNLRKVRMRMTEEKNDGGRLGALMLSLVAVASG